jgi:hypothetical protein
MIYALSAFGLLLVGYGFLMLKSNSQRARIKAERADTTVENFVREFDGSSYAHEALKTAYTDLTQLSGLPVRRADDLEKTLGLLPEDFERMFEKRCRQLGLADVWKSSHKALLPLKTAEDYVRFLSVVINEQAKTAERK